MEKTQSEKNLAMSSNEKKAHLALLGTNLIYGAGFTVAKILMPYYLQPRAFILLRVSVATLLFWITYMLIARGEKSFSSLSKSNKIRVVIGGICGVALNQILFFEGLSLTLPIHAAIIMLTTPIMVTLFSALYLRQKLGVYKILGVFLGAAGALILVYFRSNSSYSYAPDILKGDFLIFLNAFFYSIYLVIIKPVMSERRSIQVITWVFTVGAFIVIPLGYGQLNNIRWSEFGEIQWAALLFIILGVTYFTYLWNAYAIKVLNPLIAGAYIYSQPLFATLISLFYFGEKLSLTKILAALIIGGGVYLVNFKKK